MTKPHEEVPAGPPRLVRWLVSLLILGHFFTIGSAVTSVPPAPEPAVRARNFSRAYLHFMYLTNAYRFFAPDPGPAQILWFRIQHEDGTVRWVEFPQRDRHWVRMPYQRGLCIPMTLYRHVNPNAESPGHSVQFACSASHARFVARAYATPGNPVRYIQIYILNHGMLAPQEVRQGIKPADLRLYEPGSPTGPVSPVYLGSYEADGALMERPETLPRLIPVFDVATQIISEIHERGVDPKAPDLPPAIRYLLAKEPGLLGPDARRQQRQSDEEYLRELQKRVDAAVTKPEPPS